MRVPPLLELISADIDVVRFFKGLPPTALGKARCMASPSFVCTTIYRVAHALCAGNVPLLPRVLWWLNFLLFKVDLDQRAKLYGGLYLPHPMMIVIGKGTQLRGAAKIMHGATLGGSLGRKRAYADAVVDQPVLNGRFFIGINALIAGPVVLSGDVFVSPSSVVSRDFNNVCVYGANQAKSLNDALTMELPR